MHDEAPKISKDNFKKEAPRDYITSIGELIRKDPVLSVKFNSEKERLIDVLHDRNLLTNLTS